METNKKSNFLYYYMHETIFNFVAHFKNRKRKLYDYIIFNGVRNTILSYSFYLLLIIFDLLILKIPEILTSLNITIFWPVVPILTIIIAGLFTIIIEIFFLFSVYSQKNIRKKIEISKISFWAFLHDIYVFRLGKIEYLPRKRERDSLPYIFAMLVSMVISVTLSFIFYYRIILSKDLDIIESKIIGNIFLWVSFILYLTLTRLFALIYKYKYCLKVSENESAFI